MRLVSTSFFPSSWSFSPFAQISLVALIASSSAGYVVSIVRVFSVFRVSAIVPHSVTFSTSVIEIWPVFFFLYKKKRKIREKYKDQFETSLTNKF